MSKKPMSWEDADTLNNIGTGLQVGGMLTKAQGQLESGDAAKASADFVAAQLRDKAGRVLAGSQLEAYGVQREADYTASKAIAMAGASGAGANDPTVVNLMATNAQEFAYRKMLALYQGEDQARTLNLEADTKQYEGEVAKYNAQRAATGTVMQAGANLMLGYANGATMFKRFGGGGPGQG